MVDKYQKGSANIAGAGAGTGLLGLANMIPDQYQVYRNILIYISPTAAVGISFVWMFVSSIVSRKIVNSELNKAICDVRKIRDDVFANVSTTNEHKHKLQENVEKLEKLALEVISDNAEHVRSKLKEIR